MAKKKATTTRKRKTTKKSTSTAEPQTSDEAVNEAEAETASPKRKKATRAKKASPKRKSTRKKATKTAAKSAKAKAPVTAEVPVGSESDAAPAADNAAAKPARKKTKAKKKVARIKKKVKAARKSTRARTARPAVAKSLQPRAEGAQVEARDKSIVIRFPDPDDPTDDANEAGVEEGAIDAFDDTELDDVDAVGEEDDVAEIEDAAPAVDDDELDVDDDDDDIFERGMDFDDDYEHDEPRGERVADDEDTDVDVESDDDDSADGDDDRGNRREPRKDAGEDDDGRGRRRRRRRRGGRRRGRGGGDDSGERAAEEQREAAPRRAVEEDEQPPRDEEDGDKPRRRRRRGGRRRRRDDVDDVEPTRESKRDGKKGPALRKEMVINVVPHEECRIAILEDGLLQEIYIERASSENHVGNIYKGIVTNVEPSIQAAFIDFGNGKNGFLHISDLHPEFFPNGDGNSENVGRKTPRRNRPPIQKCLRRGQELLVQITKEGIGTKGPTLTTYLSIPGRFLVMMPGMRQLGVSRKIEDEDQRRSLRALLNELDLDGSMGFIARTAALERTKRELQSDLNYLTRLWRAVEQRIKREKAPAELYTESDLVIRTIRDVYANDIEQIVVDNGDVAQRANEFLGIFNPRAKDIVKHYEEGVPIFHEYGVEQELERLHARHVPLKSGGSLVIDQTEALVAIDVNSGRFRTEDDAETTAYKINLEAADEIARQLRLRDLGGVVVCDFIDMRMEKHKRDIERRLAKNLKEHKERAKVLRTSQFGMIELTRQRQRASLTRSVYEDCPHCNGTGLIKSNESVVLDVMRRIQLAIADKNVRMIDVSVAPPVAELILNRKRTQLHDLETVNNQTITIRGKGELRDDQIQFSCTDARGRVLPPP